MSLLRWAFSFVGFPLGGLLAIQLVGTPANPLFAALGGGLAAILIGGAQWLALGGAANWRWLAGSVAGFAIGSALAFAITGGATTPAMMAISGLVAGAATGAGQAVALARGVWVGLLWAATVSVSWAVGWLVTLNVIVDAERGYFVFGASGAIVATVFTGIVLRGILGARPKVRTTGEAGPRVAAPTAEEVAK